VAPADSTTLRAVEIVNGLVNRPLFVTAAPGDVDRKYIVEQDGFIRLHKRGEPADQWTTFLDIQSKVVTFGGEQGLLGLAFDPDYATNGYFYVNYTELPSGRTVVARYQRSATDPDVADPASEFVILTRSQPQSNHNGGQLLFDNDGYLLVFFGDGGGGGDPHGVCGNGQNLETLLGKIVRIDVHDTPGSLDPDCSLTANYRVPADNPLVDGAGGTCDEIYGIGVRNPWRNDVDPVTGDLYVADVGETCWEEINWVSGDEVGGQNFGWRQMEGAHCHDAFVEDCDPPNVPCGSSPDCFDPSLTLPVKEYASGSGCSSVTGGVVYRGCLMPDLSGTYFWGDYCGGNVETFRIVDGAVTDERDRTNEILDPPDRLRVELTSFGKDAQNELFIVDRSGEILKVLPIFENLEVAGPGSGTPLLLGESEWTWEDLRYATEHPVDFYRVYRGVPNGVYDCVVATPEPRWEGGDPEDPQPGEVFSYLVSAVTSAGAGGETGVGEPADARTIGSRDCF
jgi:glucose/arabinose dehydrogenase